MFKGRAAFTVLESLIVLLITMVGLTISMMMVNLFRLNHHDENYFWHVFSSQWHLVEYQSIHDQVTTTVSFNASHVVFANQSQSDPVIINYPKGVKLLDRPTQIIIHPNGYVSPKTIHWYFEHSHQFWQQKFQLGWGVYRLEKAN